MSLPKLFTQNIGLNRACMQGFRSQNVTNISSITRNVTTEPQELVDDDKHACDLCVTHPCDQRSELATNEWKKKRWKMESQTCGARGYKKG